jgi:hypothetical protein
MAESAKTMKPYDALMALRNQVLKLPYDLPGGTRVWVWGLSHLQAKQWYADQRGEQAEGGGPDPYGDARMIVRSVRDDAGKPVFTEADLTRIVELPEVIVQNLVRLCMKVNGIGRVETQEIRKNFEKALGADS